MTKLKPCPFCGNSASVSTPFVHAKCAWVKCNTCGAKTKKIRIYDMCSNEHIITLDKCKEKAIVTWNTRAEPEARTLTLEELREKDGKPVWFTTISGECGVWGLINIPNNCVMAVYGTTRYFKDYGKTWLAYDRSWKENEHEVD